MKYHIKLIKIAKNPLAAYQEFMRNRALLKLSKANLIETPTKGNKTLKKRRFELSKIITEI